MLRVYEIIEVKSRASCHVKFQGHGMVILPGLRPAAVDAARNKQLDCNDCFVAITSDFEISRFTPVSFKIVAQSGWSVLWKLTLRHATRACLKQAGLPTPRTE